MFRRLACFPTVVLISRFCPLNHHPQGTLLDKPVTEKETVTETGPDGIEFGVSAMQVNASHDKCSGCELVCDVRTHTRKARGTNCEEIASRVMSRSLVKARCYSCKLEILVMYVMASRCVVDDLAETLWCPPLAPAPPPHTVKRRDGG